MVVYIYKLAVAEKQWLDEKTFRDGVALCQMIRGAISMQTAVYVGLKTRGVIGAGASFIGYSINPIVVIMCAALSGFAFIKIEQQPMCFIFCNDHC